MPGTSENKPNSPASFDLYEQFAKFLQQSMNLSSPAPSANLTLKVKLTSTKDSLWIRLMKIALGGRGGAPILQGYLHPPANGSNVHNLGTGGSIGVYMADWEYWWQPCKQCLQVFNCKGPMGRFGRHLWVRNGSPTNLRSAQALLHHKACKSTTGGPLWPVPRPMDDHRLNGPQSHGVS